MGNNLSENQYHSLLKEKMSEESFAKLTALANEKLFNFVGEYTELCQPDSLYMCDDSDEDAEYVRKRSIELGEETPLGRDGHTMHYDGYNDQARDKKNTKYLVAPEDMEVMKNLNVLERDKGVAEIKGIMKGIMKGKQAIVKLFCEGPTLSPFSIGCVQISDSCYVLHSEDILYRRGYEHFMKMEDKNDFFRFIHSAGELDERGCSVNLDKRRIYQDFEEMMVFSANDQYAGNSVGLKKHSMRLAIKKSGQENWLCEHMFIMGVINEEKKRKSYFCGAFPSACGKTSTAMLPGEKIVGDDIAYFRNINGKFKAVNVENGIFGIIKDVNAKDDPLIFKTLQEGGREIIFSNVLTGPDNLPYWLGMGVDAPKEGKNHFGEWKEGIKDKDGKTVGIAHGNARYTMRLEYLDNVDHVFNDKNGVDVDGIVYGGRDGDTSVPVEESFNWEEGIILKACTLESETTSATLGQEGVRVPQIMANQDFISYPIGKYVQNNIDFVKGMNKVPPIYCVNYFRKDDNGDFLTGKLAKKVWMHWAELRSHNEIDAYKTPMGFIPKYEDLKKLFKELLDEDFKEEDYKTLFSFRIDQWIAKLNRATEYFKKTVPDCPQKVYDVWNKTIEKLEAAKKVYGETIEPGKYN